MEAANNKQLIRFQKKLAKYKLLIIDELGYVFLSSAGAELLFEVFSQRYERGAINCHTNLPFNEWTQAFGSECPTGALPDRLTNQLHILERNGESYRLKYSRKHKHFNPQIQRSALKRISVASICIRPSLTGYLAFKSSIAI